MLAVPLKQMLSSRAWISVINVLLIINLRITSAKSLKKREFDSSVDCPLPNCSCELNGALFKMQCPVGDPDIKFIQEYDRTTIQCIHSSEEDYSSLPQMNLNNTKELNVVKCPLVKDKSFGSILKKIGSHNVQKMRFVSYESESIELFKCYGTLGPKVDEASYFEIFLLLRSEGALGNMQRLNYLTLCGNNLQNLTRKSFEGASFIITLNLILNKLTSLDSDVFKLLTNLKTINLISNSLSSFPEDLFASNKKLRSIFLFQQQTTLPARFLADLDQLDDVRINGEIENLPKDMFLGSRNISNIDLAMNHLEEVPAVLFLNQYELKRLNISHNKLADLPDNIFFYTTELEVLDLSFNKLKNITRYHFAYLFKLSELYLQNNNLLQIDELTFRDTKNLQTLELQNNCLLAENNGIWNANDEFFYPYKMKALNLRNTSLSHILPFCIPKYVHLQNLDLSYNKLNTLNISDLALSETFISVNLGHNTIAEIDFSKIADITLGKSTISLDLGESSLICDCHILHFVQFLRGDNATQIRNKLIIVPTDLRCAGPQELIGRLLHSLDYRELLCPFDSNSSSIEGCPSACKCQARLVDLTIVVNCSQSGLREVPRLPDQSLFNTRFIELHMQYNNITKLPDGGHPGYNSVTKLYAQHNKISKISADNIPTQLSVLDISNNSISWINASVFEAFNRTTNFTEVYLGKNPWRCDCNALALLSFVRTNHNLIQDLNSMRCSSGAQLASLSAGEMCQSHLVLTTLSYIAAILGILFTSIAALYYRFQAEIKAWLYAHNMFLWFVTEEEVDKDKKYDAFISYSNKDEDFIADQLLPNLENGPVKYKLCLHERDWVAGDFIPNQIIRSVEESRRTIIVLSPNFLESVWGRMEFQAAHKSALREGRARIIIIVYGEIGNTKELDPDIKAYLNMNTYIKWGDPGFWNKLRFALPHASPASREIDNHDREIPITEEFQLRPAKAIMPLQPTETPAE